MNLPYTNPLLKGFPTFLFCLSKIHPNFDPHETLCHYPHFTFLHPGRDTHPLYNRDPPTCY